MLEERCVVGILKLLRDPLWRIKFEEFKKLVRVLGYDIVHEVIQTKEKPISSTLFGKGKIKEIKQVIEEKNANKFIVYNTLRSIQKLNLELSLGVEVLDRYDITLEIFSENANDKVSKLQIELAKIEKEIPYIKMLTKIRFQKDRPFFKAGGEYAYKPKLAELRKRRKKILETIKKLRNEKLNKIIERKQNGFKIVTIVGYYNAGKTSLFNALTGEKKAVSDIPFTTLESKYSKIPGLERILLVDTIGFVLDLDPRIIKSFEINVDDMRQSDGLIVVIDASDDNRLLAIKARTVLKTLKDIGAINNKPILITLNKIDLVNDEFKIGEALNVIETELDKNNLSSDTPIVKISAKKRQGLEQLLKKLSEKFLGTS